jgi:hypothetical protein
MMMQGSIASVFVNRRLEKEWLGGLDSNQDSQIQSLESYQLDDLPAGRNKNEPRHFPGDRDSHDSTLLI